MITYLIASSFIVVLLTVFFMLTVLFRRELNQRNITFSIFAASVGWWAFSHMMWQLSASPESALFWCRMLVWGSTFIPITYLDFVSSLTRRRPRFLIAAGYCLALAIAVANTGDLVIDRVEPAMQFPYWPKAGPLFHLYFGYFAAFVVFCFYLLVRRYRTSSPQSQNQLQYMILGTALGFAGGSTNFFLWMDIPIPPVGHGLSVFYILGIGYSVIKYRLLQFNDLVLHAIGLVFAAALLSLVVSGLSYHLIDPRDAGEASLTFYRLWMVTGVIALILLFLAPVYTRAVDRMRDAVGLSRRSLNRQRLNEIGLNLIRIEDEGTIFSGLVRAVQQVYPTRHTAVYHRGEFEQNYRLRSALPTNNRYADTLSPASLSLLIDRLLARQRSVIVSELHQRRTDRESHLNGSIPADTFHSEDLIVPFINDKVLDGFLILGPRTDRRIFTEMDISLLENLCSQIGLTIRSRQVERRANQVEKLVSLGTLAAGLAHELRNPLVSIKTFGTLLQDRFSGNGESGEFAKVVQRDIHRISNIIENVASFAENRSIAYTEVDINEVISRTYQIEKHRLDRAGVSVVFTPSRMPPVKANFNQLIQVFINLFENALQALADTEEKRITVNMNRIGDRDRQFWVEVEVIDTGPGIPEEMLPQVFEPFFTTKDTGARPEGGGTGLGLAIVKRIVDAHRGASTIENAETGGTRVRIILPAVS